MSVADGNGCGGPELSEQLPYELLVHAVAQLDSPFDLQAVAQASKAFHAVAHEEPVWRSLVNQRYGLSVQHPAGFSVVGDAMEEFRERWHSAQETIRAVPNLGSEGRRPSLCSTLSSTIQRGLPICCSSEPSKEDLGVSESDLKQGVSAMAEALSCGAVSVADMVDWLLTDAAARQPIRCLAMLALLQPPPPPPPAAPQASDAAANEAAHAPPFCPQAFSEAAAAARSRLMAASPPRALRERIVIKWWSWSTARDCRGFRARDDMHRITADLATLCREPGHELWAVLTRGVVNEVRSIRVNVAE